MSVVNRPLVIAGRTFQSRLLAGTGKFSSPEAMRDALICLADDSGKNRFARLVNSN